MIILRQRCYAEGIDEKKKQRKVISGLRAALIASNQSNQDNIDLHNRLHNQMVIDHTNQINLQNHLMASRIT